MTTDDARGTTLPSLEELEAEGDVGADYIEGLLDIADLDGDLTIEVRNQRAYLSVTSETASEGLSRLSDPETVNALQELTRLAVQAKSNVFSRLILDIGGSREAREDALRALVTAAAEQLDSGADSAALPPMSSYERKLVHDFVAEAGLVSESAGEGRLRHTVITRS